MTPEPKTVRVSDLANNLQVRRISGRHLGQAKPITRATLLRWRQDGFPKPLRVLPGKYELWDAREVRQWLKDTKPQEE